MTNAKISALTSATTPLAGTEVLPIVQSSATTKVTVANLTAGRAVSGLSFAAATIGAPASTTLSIQANGTTYATVLGAGTNNGFIGIGTASPASMLSVVSASTGVAEFDGPANAAVVFKGSGYVEGKIQCGGQFNIGSTNNYPMAFLVNGSESARIDTSGNLLVGTTSASGSSTNTASVVGGVFSTASGIASSIASGTATTIFTVPSGKANWVYIVSADVNSGAPSVYSCVYLVTSDAGVLRATALQSATLNVVSVSGTNIQVTQGSGAAASVYWTVTRVS